MSGEEDEKRLMLSVGPFYVFAFTQTHHKPQEVKNFKKHVNISLVLKMVLDSHLNVFYLM